MITIDQNLPWLLGQLAMLIVGYSVAKHAKYKFIANTCMQFLSNVFGTCIYNLYFHPLAKFPGPVLGRASLLWRFIHTGQGRIHLSIEKLHQKYGSIVRISPNELAFASVESWKTIYGHAAPGKPTAIKAAFYEIFGAGFDSGCIGSERNPRIHSRMRKMLSAAFSQQSLLEQESLISGIIDQFIRIVGEKAPQGSQGINVTKWYEMVAFDILGEMAFGESFHSLENGKPHFWSDIIEEHLYYITLVDNLSRIRAISTLFRYFFPSIVVRQNQNSRYSRQMVERCLASTSSRKDFVTLLADKVRQGEVSKEEMTAHVSTLTIAGGETVSTLLAGGTYLLLSNPEKLNCLQAEIRGTFKAYDEINAKSAQQLPYLQAVINECLRMFPPGAQGFPRVSPGFDIEGEYIPKGTEIFTSAWTVAHDAKYFASPMEFIPERWLDQDSTDIKEASQPFSMGPRGCLGRNFAYMEINLLLAKMLWTYDLEHVNKGVDWLRDSLFYVMWWKPALEVRFREKLIAE